MVQSLANHCQFATFAQIAAATDLRRLPVRGSRSTWHTARKTTLIPSSLANRIMLRIFTGNLPRGTLILFDTTTQHIQNGGNDKDRANYHALRIRLDLRSA